MEMADSLKKTFGITWFQILAIIANGRWRCHDSSSTFFQGASVDNFPRTLFIFLYFLPVSSLTLLFCIIIRLLDRLELLPLNFPFPTLALGFIFKERDRQTDTGLDRWMS